MKKVLPKMLVVISGFLFLTVVLGSLQKQTRLSPAKAELTNETSEADATNSFVQGVPPVFYIMHDPGDYVPPANAGALGGWGWFTWKRINPGRGQFNWEEVDNYLAREAAKITRLKNGQSIKKPITISIQVMHDIANTTSALDLPGWLISAIGEANIPLMKPVPDGSCGQTYHPPWGNPLFQQAWYDMVQAFGERYNDDPRVDFIMINTGPYGETIETMYNPTCPDKRFNINPGGIFTNWAIGRQDAREAYQKGAVRIYRQAFPTKALFVINTGSASRQPMTEQALEVSPHVGIKFHSWFPDHPEGGDYKETIDYYFDRCGTDCLFGLEHAYGENRRATYWAVMYLLAHKGTLADFSPTHAQALADVEQGGNNDAFPLWEFAENRLGRNVSNTPDVWTILRETIYPGGEHGNWENYLSLINGNDARQFAPVGCKELPAAAQGQIYGCWDAENRYVARKTSPTSSYMYFRIDPNWPGKNTTGFQVEIVYLDQGTDAFDLEYRQASGTTGKEIIHKRNTGEFIRKSFELPEADFSSSIGTSDHLRINSRGDGDEIIHSLRVTPDEWIPEEFKYEAGFPKFVGVNATHIIKDEVTPVQIENAMDWLAGCGASVIRLFLEPNASEIRMTNLKHALNYGAKKGIRFIVVLGDSAIANMRPTSNFYPGNLEDYKREAKNNISNLKTEYFGAIYGWELLNEPHCNYARSPADIEEAEKNCRPSLYGFVDSFSQEIKDLDPYHRLFLGVIGRHDEEQFRWFWGEKPPTDGEYKESDYVALHHFSTIDAVEDHVYDSASQFILSDLAKAKSLGKPFFVEEFNVTEESKRVSEFRRVMALTFDPNGDDNYDDGGDGFLIWQFSIRDIPDAYDKFTFYQDDHDTSADPGTFCGIMADQAKAIDAWPQPYDLTPPKFPGRGISFGTLDSSLTEAESRFEIKVKVSHLNNQVVGSGVIQPAEKEINFPDLSDASLLLKGPIESQYIQPEVLGEISIDGRELKGTVAHPACPGEYEVTATNFTTFDIPKDLSENIIASRILQAIFVPDSGYQPGAQFTVGQPALTANNETPENCPQPEGFGAKTITKTSIGGSRFSLTGLWDRFIGWLGGVFTEEVEIPFLTRTAVPGLNTLYSQTTGPETGALSSFIPDELIPTKENRKDNTFYQAGEEEKDVPLETFGLGSFHKAIDFTQRGIMPDSLNPL